MNEWLFNLHNPGIVALILCFALMGGAVGLPIPEDIPLLTAGVLIQGKTIPGPLALAVCYVGVIAGDWIVFLLGRRFGPSLFETRWFSARFPPKRVHDIRHSLERRSLLMIFIARHLFYLRTATFLTCGAVKMNPWRFAVADCLAALVSVPLMIGIGYKCAEQYDTAVEYLSEARIASLVLVIALAAMYLIVRHMRKVKSSDSMH